MRYNPMVDGGQKMKNWKDFGFDLMPMPSGGRLLLSPHPASLRGLTPAQAIAVYKSLGVVTLVSLVTETELFKLGLTHLSAMCQHHGIDWQHAPVLDQHAPNSAFETWWHEQHPALLASLRDGHTLAFHCWGGLGRTGTVAARLLMAHELMGAAAAMDAVRRARPGAIETAAQSDYLLALQP